MSASARRFDAVYGLGYLLEVVTAALDDVASRPGADLRPFEGSYVFDDQPDNRTDAHTVCDFRST